MTTLDETVNTAMVKVVMDDPTPPPPLLVMLDREYNGYWSRIVIARDGTIAMGEPDDEQPLGVTLGQAQYGLPRDKLVEWLRTAIEMLERPA